MPILNWHQLTLAKSFIRTVSPLTHISVKNNIFMELIQVKHNVCSNHSKTLIFVCVRFYKRQGWYNQKASPGHFSAFSPLDCGVSVLRGLRSHLHVATNFLCDAGEVITQIWSNVTWYLFCFKNFPGIEVTPPSLSRNREAFWNVTSGMENHFCKGKVSLAVKLLSVV